MKGAFHDPVDHARTTQPHAGESFIDTLWLPGLLLIGLGTALIAGTIAATAYGNRELTLILALIAGALVTAGAGLVTLEHQRVKRVERRWMAEHPTADPVSHVRAA
ncbi:protein UsfY [Mycolicibacterium confluentis]|uniref:UsfY protein n=1 Tax=Mycolicibacterium confluentis TaxID=28047 RepID=A0A7I7Y1S3_9MYCO|nr:protein UsfY [Mycolicibacterium confluentis]MCV7320248.1 LapA family protein [Mycolicibacterium confluentis]ORV34767.1 UsfY protein [Mycolicibacterium confluentis]BBZ35284.1 UsfY protein [Mycolicibacterium confluentis]